MERGIRCECSKDLSTRRVDKSLLRPEEDVWMIQSLVELSGTRGRYPVRDVVRDLARALHKDMEGTMMEVDRESHMWQS